MLANEQTLLPMLIPLAPAVSLAISFAGALLNTLARLRSAAFAYDSEASEMQVVKCAKTPNRSVVGIMTEFAYLAEAYRNHDKPNDLIELSLKLARWPFSPLYKGPVSSERALKASTNDGGAVA